MKDIRQTGNYAKYLSNIGWTVERVGGNYFYIKHLPILGNFVKLQRPEKIEVRDIDFVAAKYKPFRFVVEPVNKNPADAKTNAGRQELIIKNLGFRLSKSSYLPTKTLQLDLTLSINRLIANTDKDVQYSLRKTQGLKITETESIADFLKAWRQAVGWKRYVPTLKNLEVLKSSFKKKCLLLSCFKTSKQTPEIIAGAVFLRTNNVGYYWQAFTNKEGRKALSQYKILWEGMTWAKRTGCKIFDMEGIYDERFPNKSWLGFSKFKKKFGGKEVLYPGAYIKSYGLFGKITQLPKL